MSKKILLLIPNFGFGGAQRVFADHSRLFSKFGQVEECVFNLLLANEYESGNFAYTLNVAPGNSFLSKAIRFWERVTALRKLKKKGKYDICISHLEGADYVNLLSRQSEKVILVIHGSKSADENISGLLGWIRKKILLPVLYRNADLIITVSDGIKEELQSDYAIPASSIVSIPNYFNIDEIVKASECEVDLQIQSIKEKYKVILFSGRFAAQKNIIPLFHIFKKVRQELSSVKLVLVGDGELRDSLWTECKRMNFNVYTEDKLFDDSYDVFFMGYHKNPFPIIKACDVFVMTSKWEGFPMALCEAMAIGSCVVASDCPTGPRQILEYHDVSGVMHHAGTILPIPLVGHQTTINLWAAALKEILCNRELRDKYKNEARIRVKDFSEDEVSKKWLSVLSW
jgi:glycosyltransferase involved in cell wall biosynthesis